MCCFSPDNLIFEVFVYVVDLTRPTTLILSPLPFKPVYTTTTQYQLQSHYFSTIFGFVNIKMGNISSAQSSSPSLPIDSTFDLPSPLPSWPSGEGFAKGVIDLGGLEVFQVTKFNKVWTVYEEGQDNLGATFFEPSSLPEGFSLLGFYAQPNNRKLFGWTLVGKDISGNSLRPPVDYLLLWSGKSTKVENNKDQTGYFWQPVPPDGYSAVGLIVTTTAEKPPLDKIRCVRSDLTDQSEPDALIWESNGFSVSSSKPVNRGTQASSVCVGTFTSNPTLACLKNNKFDFSCMPSKVQIDALFKTYAPLIYFHKDEKYLPSSVNWFFSNGALLYKKGEESNPVPIEPNGSNLPQGEANDGLYWLDLPVASDARKRVQGGDLQSMEVYLHIKPVYGGTLTDIAVWMFYPFNGPSRAKLKLATIPLGRIGEHIGDWEHFTLRISNFSGKLRRMYLSQHSKGSWIDAPEIEFQSGGNKPVAYASLNGHAMYSKPGLVLQGRDDVGIRNDTGKSEKVFDTAVRFRVVSAEYLKEVEEPAWLNYMRHWGPKIDYGREDEIRCVEKIVVGESLKSMFRSAVNGLPNEVFGEEGPTGPKLKRNWLGDED